MRARRSPPNIGSRWSDELAIGAAVAAPVAEDLAGASQQRTTNGAHCEYIHRVAAAIALFYLAALHVTRSPRRATTSSPTTAIAETGAGLDRPEYFWSNPAFSDRWQPSAVLQNDLITVEIDKCPPAAIPVGIERRGGDEA